MVGCGQASPWQFVVSKSALDTVRGGTSSQPHIPFHIEVEDRSKGVDFSVVAFQLKAGDRCLLEENVPGDFNRVCYVYRECG